MSGEVEVACFGEPLVGFYAKKTTPEELSSFTMVIGGDTSNVALAIAKLGHTAMYITKLGDDIFGEQIWKAWDKANVDTSGVFIDNCHQTGIYFTFFDHTGRHRFVYRRKNSAAANFTLEDARKVSLKGVKVFHLSGISQAISKDCLEVSFYFMQKCKQLGIMVSYDVNYRDLLWGREFFNSVAWFTIRHFADVVSLNLDEARILGLSGKPEKVVEEIINVGPKFVAIKLGKAGCVFGSSEGVEYCKSFNVPVVDTVGAGDALTAAIIVGILEDMSCKYIVCFANAVASMVCGSVGSTSGQPTRKEVEKFMTARRLGENSNIP